MIDFSLLTELDISYLNKKKLQRKYIYFLLDNITVVYVGLTGSIEYRIKNHINGISKSYYRNKEKKKFDKAFYIEFPESNNDEMKLLEHCLIYKFRPKYNRKTHQKVALNFLSEASINELINKYFKNEKEKVS